MAIDNSTLQLDHDAVQAIRRALLIGLQSFGEIERVMTFIDDIKSQGINFPDVLTPRHPTDNSDTISEFATALHLLN